MPDIAALKEAAGWKGALKGVRSDLDLAEWMTQNKAPRTMADALFKALGLPAELQHRVIPKATYHRNEFLSDTALERLLRLARLYAQACALFDGDKREAAAFLNEPHALLNGKAPAELALSEPGYREAEFLLRKVAFGLPV